MNILELTKTFRGIPVFSIGDIEKHFPNFERENLLNWQKKGVLLFCCEFETVGIA